MLNKVLDGLNSKLRSSKYAALADCSKPTAVRDLGDLMAKGMLRVDPDAGGRSTHYVLNWPGADLEEASTTSAREG